MDVEEHRLALVLNGGVSLAVWMGGVAHEIDVVRRATDPRVADPSVEPEEQDVIDLWAKACTGRPRIRVDVIAGTSAGGLNGVFLAAAIARGGTLAPLKDLWMRRAQLDATALLKPPPGSVNSLLNGDFFLTSIEEALGDIRPVAGVQPREVSLVTTASAVGGPPRTVRDSAGKPFPFADHRRRYRFRRGNGGYSYSAPNLVPDFRKEDDVDELTTSAAALARAGRATASIPGVFDAVAETEDLRARRRMPDGTGGTLDWLLDGGLLDNAPFDAVLDAIVKQPVSTTWARTIAYVVPSTADAAVPPKQQTGLPPWSATVPTLQSYPGEANLRDGIDRLDAMRSAARPDVDPGRFTALVTGGTTGLQAIDAAARGLFDFYRASRATAALLDAAGGDPAPAADVDDALALPPSWIPDAPTHVLGQAWHWGCDAADRVARLFLSSIRELPGADEERARLTRVVEQLHAVKNAKQVALRSERPPDQTLAQHVSTAYDTLAVPEALGGLIDDAAAAVASALGVSNADAVTAALSLEIVNGAPGLPVEYHPIPTFGFHPFTVAAMPKLFGIDLGGRDPADLLYGDRLGHFAAFGDPAWRQWDWMWGRISAAIHLAELLELGEAETREIVEAIVRAEGATPTELQKGAERTLGTEESGAALFERMRADGTIGIAADALLRLGQSPATTDPAAAASVLTIGSLLAALLARSPKARFPTGAPRRRPMLQRLLLRATFRLLPRGRGTTPATPVRTWPRARRALGIVRVVLWGWLVP